MHPCSELQFLRQQLFLFPDSWLLISVGAALFFVEVFTASKNFSSLDMYNYKSKSYSKLVAIKLRYVSRGTCLE